MRRELMRESWWGREREKREGRNIKCGRGNNLINYESYRYQREIVFNREQFS